MPPMSIWNKLKFTAGEKRRIEVRALHIVLAVLAGLVMASGLVMYQINQDEQRLLDLRHDGQQEVAQPQLPPNTPHIGGPFDLVNQDGKTVTQEDFAGKFLLVYFGYTYCPDMCPTGLQSMSRALDILKDEAKQIQPLFITIDPSRDTPAKMKEYVASFNPQIVGLTGEADEIDKVAKEYQVYYKRGENVDGKDYVMDHSSLIYLMAPDGSFIATYPEEVDPATLVDALKMAMAPSKL